MTLRGGGLVVTAAGYPVQKGDSWCVFGDDATTGGALFQALAGGHGSCDSAVINGVGGLLIGTSVTASGGVHAGGRPVIQGYSRGQLSSVFY